MLSPLLMLLTLSAWPPQAGTRLDQPVPEAFTPAERKRIAAEAKIDGRIKVYTAAVSDRYKQLAAAVAADKPEAVAQVLDSWMQVLDFSLQDIRTHAGRRSKSRALRRFEIELRKAIGALDDLRVSVPFEQMQAVESFIGRAEKIRAAIVAILFPN